MSDIYYCTPSGGKTLEDALNAVREARRNGYENPLTISILEDIYLDAPITLDLSLGNLTLTSPNKSKIIGGISLADWKRDCFHGTECISTQIPKDREGNTSFPTDLFIEGKRASATRYPKTGTLRAVRTGLDAPFDNSYLALMRGTTDWFVASPEDLAAAGDISGAMVNYYHYWLDEHSPIRSFDLATGRIDMTYRSRFALTAYYDEGDNAAMHYYFTGVSGTFHEAGEWYADRKTNTIYYIPENKSETTSLIGYIPTLAHLFYITGENIHIENLELLATRSDYASTMCLDDITKEYVPGSNLYGSDIQSVCWASGAVIFEGAKNASVTNCYLHALGVHAIDIREGCENIRIEQNHIEDIAAGGIRVFGGAYGCERERITSHITIRKNEIAYCGKRYEAGCGILVCHASYNEISENEVHDIGYTGISVGWVWGYGDSSTHHNLIANNHIYNIGNGNLSDMGGIYLLGKQPGTILKENRIHDVTCANYGAWGIYLDEGTSFVRVEGNLIYRTRSECFNQHYGSHNTITRNIFIAHTAPCFRVERQEPHNSLTLTENIFVTEDTPAYARDISFSFQSSHNLFLTAGEQPLVFVSKDGTPYPLATWQSAFGKDEGSTTRPLTTSPQSFLETLLTPNLSCALDKIDARIRVNIPFTKAIFSAIDGEREVLNEANELTVKGITDGGIIILR